MVLVKVTGLENFPNYWHKMTQRQGQVHSV